MEIGKLRVYSNQNIQPVYCELVRNLKMIYKRK